MHCNAKYVCVNGVCKLGFNVTFHKTWIFLPNEHFIGTLMRRSFCRMKMLLVKFVGHCFMSSSFSFSTFRPLCSNAYKLKKKENKLKTIFLVRNFYFILLASLDGDLHRTICCSNIQNIIFLDHWLDLNEGNMYNLVRPKIIESILMNLITYTAKLGYNELNGTLNICPP